MGEVVIKVDVPENFEHIIKKDVERFVKKKVQDLLLIELLDNVTKGAKKLSEDELIEMANKIKTKRVKELKKAGLV